MDITVIVMDNGTFALTKNQNSPTSRPGLKGTLSSPLGNQDEPLNPIELMITYGATFVAQTYSANAKHQTKILDAALAHKGFAFVNVVSPCPTYNKVDTFAYFRPKIHDINESGEHTNLNDRASALLKAGELYKHHRDESAPVPVGIFYQVQKPVFMEKVNKVKAFYKADQGLDWDAVLDRFKP